MSKAGPFSFIGSQNLHLLHLISHITKTLSVVYGRNHDPPPSPSSLSHLTPRRRSRYIPATRERRMIQPMKSDSCSYHSIDQREVTEA